MADNFDMKKFLTENKLGPYARARVNEGEAAYEYEKGKAAGEEIEKKKLAKEDIGGNIGDAEAEKQMDFLAEREKSYFIQGGKCYEQDDEGNTDEVDWSYCKRYASDYESEKYNEGKDKEEEQFGGVNEAVDMKSIQKVEMALQNLLRNIATNSNISTDEKSGLINALGELQDFVDEVGYDAEVEQDEYASDYSKRRASELNEDDLGEESVRMFKSDNPEGDQLVLRFLKGIAQKFDYPVQQAAFFVKERIKKLGY